MAHYAGQRDYQGQTAGEAVLIVLETDADRERERLVIERFVALSEKKLEIMGSTPRSSTDYYLAENSIIVYLVDVKTRKESAEKVMAYPDGLMCRERKVAEFRQLGELLNVRTFLLWGFDNGEGAMFIAEPDHIDGLTGQTPPRRKNYRGEIFDDLESVVYLDWTKHLTRVA